MKSTVSNKKRLRSICALALAGGMVLATAAEAAVGVRTSRKLAEFAPAADLVGGKRFVGWSQGPRRKERFNAFVKRGGRNPVRINRRGTRAYMGGIDGQVAVYQEISNGDSDIRRFNLQSSDRAGYKVNSSRWEFGPTISGRFLLFGRNSKQDSVILFNKKSGDSRTLASVRKKGGGFPLAHPGQVNGDYAVFYRCSRNFDSCDVVRYRISTQQFLTVRSKRTYQYGPSVTRTGTVYFAGSGSTCGANTNIYRFRSGNITRIAKLGRDTEMFGGTRVAPRPGGGVDVYHSKARCKNARGLGENPNLNVYRVGG